MKYSLELTDNGNIKETFSLTDKNQKCQTFECIYECDDEGCALLTEPISSQMMQSKNIQKETIDTFKAIFDESYIVLDFLALIENVEK